MRLNFVPALQAGKDVYQEKTMAFTPDHAKRMRQADAAAKRVVQIGIQSTSSPAFAEAKRLATPDHMGTITLLHTHHYRNAPYGGWKRPIPADCDPAHVDWGAFQGEAALSLSTATGTSTGGFIGIIRAAMCSKTWFIRWGSGLKALDLKIPQSVTMTGANFLSPLMQPPDTMDVSMRHENLLFTWNSAFGNRHYGETDDVLGGNKGTVLRDKEERVKFISEQRRRERRSQERLCIRRVGCDQRFGRNLGPHAELHGLRAQPRRAQLPLRDRLPIRDRLPDGSQILSGRSDRPLGCEPRGDRLGASRVPAMLRLLHVASSVVIAMAACGQAEAQGQAQPQRQGQRQAAGPSPTPDRRHPPPGIVVPEDVRKELTEKLVPLTQAIAELSKSRDQKVLALLPDVQIFQKGVHDALTYNEFFEIREFADARRAIEQGLERAQQLKAGTAPWTTQIGLVPRAYVSKIDGSIQPYGLVVPPSYFPHGSQKYQLSIWLHGNHNKWSELAFLRKKQSWGERGDLVFMPKDTIVLHPYGRFCNPYRVAGEMDVLEAIEAVKKAYNIDEDRVAMCGFSMGGMGCWQFATHYADRWVLAQPGGSEVDPAERGRFYKATTSWQKKLIHWYHSGEVALNLFNLPTVAYSGDRDGSSNRGGNEMKAALKALSIDLVHLIGPNTQHAFHPGVRDEVERRIVSIAAKGRDRFPRQVKLATYTLKYNRMHWVTIDRLEDHWEPARGRRVFRTRNRDGRDAERDGAEPVVPSGLGAVQRGGDGRGVDRWSDPDRPTAGL